MPVPGQPKVGTRLPLPSAKSRFRSTSATPAYSCATTKAGSRPIRKQSSAISARSISMSSKIGFWILTRRDLAAAAHHDPFEPEFGDAALEFARGLVGVVDAKPAMPT